MKKDPQGNVRGIFPPATGWFVIVGLSLTSLGILGYKYYQLHKNYIITKTELASTTATLTTQMQTLEKLLSETEHKNTGLQDALQHEQIRNNAYEEQIQNISSTVGHLYKLSQTDRELLQKYSNVYFLNENYVPSTLSDIDPSLLQRKDKVEKIHTTIKPYLEALMRDAQANNIPLSILSAYRSFDTQTTLKTSYKIQYGTTAANRFSADQGYSEHQLGSTVDFTTPLNGETLSKFEGTSAYTWLLENAYRYGFVLSYPKGNTFFQFEPWHWRFVGVELATRLHNENKYFYDLDQRDINTYLGKIFE